MPVNSEGEGERLGIWAVWAMGKYERSWANFAKEVIMQRNSDVSRFLNTYNWYTLYIQIFV